jgi:small subunit ribosomal protein S17
MADEEKNESTEETPEEAPAAEAATEEPQGDEAAGEPAAEQPAADTGTPGGEAEDVAGGDSEPAAEQPAADTGTPGGEAEDVAGGDSLGPKQRRKLARAQHSGEARPQRTPEERVSERAAERARKAANRRRRRATERQKHAAGTGTPTAEREPGSKKVRLGKVVSDKADKTITVQVEVVRRHPVYEKVIRRSTTIHAHDERNEAHAGDVVRVIESRPLSRTKRWRLVEVLERAR